jgi:predicted RNA-binding Zn ribbon-like protein
VSVVDLPLVGGHPALDLINTKERGLPSPDRQPQDYLADPVALLVWALRADLIGDAEAEAVELAWAGDPGSAAATLDDVRTVREALHTALLGVTDLVRIDAAAQRAALEELHARWVAAVGRASLLIDTDDQPAVRLVVGGVPALLVLDRAAEAAVDILRSGQLARVRRCPTDSGGCGWVFVDQTRNRSRRWCRMADCGTQVKARRLTERRRAARASSHSTSSGRRRG